MADEFIFTIVVRDYEKEMAESIINKNISFKDNIQLVILADVDDLALNYPNNIIICDEISKDDIHGKYVIMGNAIFDENLFDEIHDFILDHDDLDIIRLDGSYGGQIIDLDKSYKHSLLKSNSTFIKSGLIDDYDGNIDFTINERFIEAKKCGVIHVDADESLDFDFNRNMELYESLLGRFPDDEFVQYSIIKDLSPLILHNNDACYRDRISEMLEDIDVETIKNHDSIDNLLKKFLIYLKTGDFHHEIKKDKLYLKTSDTVVNGLHGHGISLDIIDVRNDVLLISGVFKSSCDPDFLDYEAIVKYDDGREEMFVASKYEYHKTGRARVSYLGIDWRFFSCFDFRIPITGDAGLRLNFAIRFRQGNDEMILHPKVSPANTCYISKYCSHFSKNSKVVLFDGKSICVFADSFGFKARNELKSLKKIIKSDEKNSSYAVFIRLLYYVLYPFWAKKRIWLFVDRPMIADDNAEHLFSYAAGRNDDVSKYFVLDKKSDDFKRMKSVSGNVVDINSLKYKLLYMYAEKFISSHTAKTFSNPFEDMNLKLFSNLATPDRCLLQHGITIHDVSHWFIKYIYNFRLIVTASDLEKASMDYPNLNYDEDVINTLGFPRYDNLTNGELKNQILFMPTWRKHITSEEEFLDSDYFKMIDSFFNNPELLEFLKANDFKVMFKPHFGVSNYVHLLDIPPEVVLCKDTPYQELFNKSRLLITDYSSVFFDFAYLKKPVIYYRAGDEYHNKSGYFDFETMGFGEIIKSEDALIDKIKQYFNDDFEMEDEYVNKVDDFFKFTDKNNCKRVYDWLYENK